MTKYIERVDYRHPLSPTAYLVVSGRTALEAENNAKRVGTVLRRNLPTGTTVQPHRNMKLDGDRLWRCVIPINVGTQEPAAKPVLAAMVLRGSV